MQLLFLKVAGNRFLEMIGSRIVAKIRFLEAAENRAVSKNRGILEAFENNSRFYKCIFIGSSIWRPLEKSQFPAVSTVNGSCCYKSNL